MKNYLRLLQFTRQFSLGLLILGGVFYLDQISFGPTILSIGGIGFAFYSFLSAFKPIHEEPNWELVYPELALGDVDEDAPLPERKTDEDA